MSRVPLTEELLVNQATLKSTSSELQLLRDMSTHQCKRITEMLTNLLKDLGEIGVAIGGDENLKVIPDSNGTLEEEFTVAQLYISEMKSKVKNLVQRCQGLESTRTDCKKNEARIQSLQEAIEEEETRKRALKEDVDAMREECAKLNAAEQVQAVSNKEKAEELEAATKMRLALEEQLDQLRDAHQKQVATFQDEISEKQEMISELKDLNQKFILAHQQMQSHYERLKQKEADKSVRLQELELVNERCEQDRKDLKVLEETVSKELQNLHNLQKMFVQDLQTRMKKSIVTDDN